MGEEGENLFTPGARPTDTWSMRYRTRLVILLSGVAAGSTALSVGLLLWEFEGTYRDELRSKHLTLAHSAAALIDADAAGQVRSREDEGSPAYAVVRDQLRAFRDANQREDAFVQYAFTLVRSREDGRTLVYGANAEGDFKRSSMTGEVFHSAGEPVEFGVARADRHEREDSLGRWFSAFAPVRNRAGETVAMVGIDVPAGRVEGKLLDVAKQALGALLAAVLAAWGAARLAATPATRGLHDVHQAVRRLGEGRLDTQVAPVRGLGASDELVALGRGVNELAEKLREREKLRSSFARYVSQQVMDTVLSNPDGAKLEGQRRRVTLLFADIRGFTTLSESMRPEQVVALLNEYFEAMIDVILRNGGTLDKFIGDGIMAFFGAPGDDPLQEEHAVRAAVEMQEALAGLRAKWKAEGKPEVRIGVGVHSGAAIVGNIGSSQRMQYTAVGDTVNVASRLESATKELGVEVLVSESTFDGCRGAVKLARLGEIHVKGRGAPVAVYGVEGVPGAGVAKAP